MSHYPVLVIGPDPAAQLQPFHEFECTGVDDQYVVEVDRTERFRREYASGERLVYTLPDGAIVEARDDRLFRDPTEEEEREYGPMIGSGYSQRVTYQSKDWGDGLGYRAKILDPASAGAIAWSRKHADSMTLIEFANWCTGGEYKNIVGPGESPNLTGGGKYGYIRVNDRGEVVAIIDRTNPNGEWDFWHFGGRWIRHFLPVKAGRRGSVGNTTSRHSSPPQSFAYQLTVGDVDFDALRPRWKDIVPYAVVHDGKWETEDGVDGWGDKVLAMLEGLPESTLLTLVDIHC